MNFFNKISALPYNLVFDLNLHNFHYTSDFHLEEDSFYLFLEENLSLENHYDQIYCDSNRKDWNYELTTFIGHYDNSKNEHFINFSKINDKWLLFDDLSYVAFEIGDFIIVKKLIEEPKFGYLYGSKKISSKLRICNVFLKKIY